MQILVAAATELEIAPFIKSNPSADILITGVGAPAAIYHFAKRIQLIDYDLVLQAGIAGSFLPAINLGSVVLVSEDTFSDLGIQSNERFSTIFEEGLADANHLPFENGWLKNNNSFLTESGQDIVNGITVNTITDNKDHIANLASKYGAAIETMEGAALHYVCLLEEVPFMQIRSISNYIGERDKTKWDMPNAIKNLNKELQLIYERFLHENASSNH